MKKRSRGTATKVSPKNFDSDTSLDGDNANFSEPNFEKSKRKRSQRTVQVPDAE